MQDLRFFIRMFQNLQDLHIIPCDGSYSFCHKVFSRIVFIMATGISLSVNPIVILESDAIAWVKVQGQDFFAFIFVTLQYSS